MIYLFLHKTNKKNPPENFILIEYCLNSFSCFVHFNKLIKLSTLSDNREQINIVNDIL